MAGERQVRELRDDIIRSKKVRSRTRRRAFVVALLIFLLISLILTGFVLGTILFIERNSMRIYVDKNSINTFSLSATDDFSGASSVLRIKGPSEMDNITFNDVYPHILMAKENNLDGSHSGNNHIAFTFYLRNNNLVDDYVTYIEELKIINSTKGVDAAIRVLVMVDGVEEYYAKLSAIGEPEPLVPIFHPQLTTPFYDDTRIMFKDDSILNKGQVKKYSVFLWLEGEDAECTDDILGGIISIEFGISRSDIV